MMASRASHPYEALDTSRRRPRPIAKCAACALAAVAGARSLTVRRTGFAAEAVADVATDGGAPRSSGGGGGGGENGEGGRRGGGGGGGDGGDGGGGSGDGHGHAQ